MSNNQALIKTIAFSPSTSVKDYSAEFGLKLFYYIGVVRNGNYTRLAVDNFKIKIGNI